MVDNELVTCIAAVISHRLWYCPAPSPKCLFASVHSAKASIQAYPALVDCCSHLNQDDTTGRWGSLVEGPLHPALSF